MSWKAYNANQRLSQRIQRTCTEKQTGRIAAAKERREWIRKKKDTYKVNTQILLIIWVTSRSKLGKSEDIKNGF